MTAPHPATAIAVFAGLFIFIIALSVYARVVVHLRREGGEVRTDGFSISELLMSVVLVTFFLLLFASALRHQTKEGDAVHIESVLPTALLFLAISGTMVAMMRFRGARLSEVFGLRRLRPLAVAAWSAGLLIAAFPLTAAATAAAFLVLKTEFSPQPIIQLFSEAVRQGNWVAVAKIVGGAVFIQPACEEFLFRGFFYGVGKRYAGALSSGLFCSVLFAAIHASLPAFPGLLALAVCLNLAYERTGSLLVPIGMHALFNAANLGALYLHARYFSAA